MRVGINLARGYHTWALARGVDSTGHVINLARSRGCKWHNEFGYRHCYTEENYGSSINFVIDLAAAPNDSIKPFADLDGVPSS